MKHLFLLLLLLIQAYKLVAADFKEIKIPAKERPLKIYSNDNALVVSTEKGLYKIVKEKVAQSWTAPALVNATLEDDTCFWIATQHGLLTVGKKTFKSSFVLIPALEKKPNITSVLKDLSGNILIACEAYGVFKFTATGLLHQYAVYPVLSAAFTRDSSLWIGTMSGLNRFQGQEHFRYNEEGVTNFEIPGNVVDQLITDNVGHLWVFTSEGLCLFGLQEAEGHGHLPSVKFIGNQDNVISAVVYLEKRGYLFASSMGMLLLPEAQAEHVEALEENTTDKVENKSLLHKVSVQGISNFSMIQQTGKYFWLGNEDKIIRIPKKQLQKALEKKV